jgi:peptidoglycan/LPS O-acetylase OafA/YrhL
VAPPEGKLIAMAYSEPHIEKHSPLHPQYRADIDGLRAVAVLSVVGYHVFSGAIRGGFIGVDVFFVISGYLISTIIFGNLERERFSYVEFYRRRVRRIFPALLIVLAGSLIAGWFLLRSDEYAALGKDTAGSAAFVANFTFWQEVGYFDTDSALNPLLHLWSLAVEEQFYIVWPVILWIIWKLWKRGFLVLTGGLALISFTLNVLTLSTDPTADFYSPVTRLWELMVGGILAYLMLHKESHLGRGKNWSAIAGIALIVSAVFVFDAGSPYPGWRALLPTVGAFLLISAGPHVWFNRTVLAHPAAVWVGLISYPLYLWHWPLLAFAQTMNEYAELGSSTRGIRIVVVLTSFVLAWLTYLFIESPIRSGSARSVSPIILASALSMIFVIGLWLDYIAGLPMRSVDENPKSRFLQYYTWLHKSGFTLYYRKDCDFYNGQLKPAKASIAESCTTPGLKGTWFLWGDSYAQALSYGLKSILPANTSLAQVATSGCRPSLSRIAIPTPGNACNVSNDFARLRISQLRPETLILTQRNDHELTNWDEIALFAKNNGVERVFLIGPLPEWLPSLPQVVATNYFDNIKNKIIDFGISASILSTDRILRDRYGNDRDLNFISILAQLCKGSKCRARLPGKEPYDLIALDYGHLTPEGSVFVAQHILAEHLVEREAQP